MCGIAGFITSRPTATDTLHQQVKKMSDSISYRGPDGDGFWLDQKSGVALAHRRLAIVDLTESGDQPMVSSCGNFVMVYNGEVYNAASVASALTKLNLKGTSDSEVILEAFSQWGVEKTVNQLIGMFAIALWDIKRRELTLIRDRLGIKPIYWSNEDDSFIFGSELKALRQHQDCPNKLNHNAIASYLRKGYFNAPHSIFKGVNKIEPGTYLTLSSDHTTTINNYWSLAEVAEQGIANPFTGSDLEATDHLDTLLQDAVSMRMISDVPFGAFLSGGIDSSAVAALMQQASTTPIKTFSIGFDVEEYNEAQHAAEVAAHLKTDHTELYVTSNDALEVIPQLHEMYDEPFADASQIPTYIVSKLTRDYVTVALSGDGGDELFVGYDRYFLTQKYRRLLGQPKFMMSLQAKIAKSLASDSIQTRLPNSIKSRAPKHRLNRLANILKGGHLSSLYEQTLSHHENPSSLLILGEEEKSAVWTSFKDIDFSDDYSFMQFIDILDYLPDDILTKVDRASMATSLEARVPLLDHRVVEFSWALPEHMKFREGRGKWLLRQVLHRYVPQALIERPKMGFGVPIDQWLRGPLKEWSNELLSEHALVDTGIFQIAPVRQLWLEHVNGDYDWQYKLWGILNLQAWAKNNEYTL